MERAAKLAVATVDRFLREKPGLFDMVLWVLFDDRTEAAYRDAVQLISDGDSI